MPGDEEGVRGGLGMYFRWYLGDVWEASEDMVRGEKRLETYNRNDGDTRKPA